MRESDDIDQNLPAVSRDIGYVRSKWVMEKIADLAAAQGLPLMTFRLGYATCHSRTGVNADYQWWGRLVKTCISSGTVPDLRDMREGLTTVDYMTRAIAHVSRNPQALGQKFNLIHQGDNNLTLREFFSLLEREFGYRFRPLPFAQWRAQWENDSDAPLYPLLSLFMILWWTSYRRWSSIKTPIGGTAATCNASCRAAVSMSRASPASCC